MTRDIHSKAQPRTNGACAESAGAEERVTIESCLLDTKHVPAMSTLRFADLTHFSPPPLFFLEEEGGKRYAATPPSCTKKKKKDDADGRIRLVSVVCMRDSQTCLLNRQGLLPTPPPPGELPRPAWLLR